MFSISTLASSLKHPRVFPLITRTRSSPATFKPIKFLPNSCDDDCHYNQASDVVSKNILQVDLASAFWMTGR